MSNASLKLVPHPNSAVKSRGFLINVYSPPKKAAEAPLVFVVAEPIHEVGYYVNHVTFNVTLTWVDRERGQARQQLVKLPLPFYRKFPQIDRKSFGGCLEVTEAQLISLGFIVSGHSRPMMYA
jgi:hypothetical protein